MLRTLWNDNSRLAFILTNMDPISGEGVEVETLIGCCKYNMVCLLKTIMVCLVELKD